MPDVQVAAQPVRKRGTQIEYRSGVQLDAGDNYRIPNDGRIRLLLKNGAGAKVVTVVTPRTLDGNEVADLTIAVPANKDVVAGPFPPEYYGALLDVSADAVANLSLGVLAW